MKKAFPSTVIFCAVALSPAFGYASVSFDTPPSRGDNSLGLHPVAEDNDDWTILINYQDCRENLEIHLSIDDDRSSGGDLYLARGDLTDCGPDDIDGCEDLIDDIHAGGSGFKIGIRELLGKDSASDCDGTGTEKLRIAKLEDTDSGVGDWSSTSEAITIDYDMEPPTAPGGISGQPGDKKVVISWETGEDEDAGDSSGDGLDEDVASIRVIYDSTFSDELVSVGNEDTAGAEVDSETETDTGEGYDADGGVDALSGAPLELRAQFLDTETGSGSADTDDTDEQDSAPRECTQSGGFEKGASFSPDFKYKKTSTPRTGEYQVKGLRNGTYYRFAVVAFDEHENPSVISEVVCSTPDETIGYWQRYLESGGKDSGFCFVATAAFGSYDHPVVRMLRVFRDRFLAELPGGPGLIAFYYDIGPDLAAVVSDRPVLRGISVGVLTIMAVLTVPFSLFGPSGMLLIVFTLLSGGFIFSRRRRK